MPSLTDIITRGASVRTSCASSCASQVTEAQNLDRRVLYFSQFVGSLPGHRTRVLTTCRAGHNFRYRTLVGSHLAYRHDGLD